MNCTNEAVYNFKLAAFMLGRGKLMGMSGQCYHSHIRKSAIQEFRKRGNIVRNSRNWREWFLPFKSERKWYISGKRTSNLGGKCDFNFRTVNVKMQENCVEWLHCVNNFAMLVRSFLEGRLTTSMGYLTVPSRMYTITERGRILVVLKPQYVMNEANTCDTVCPFAHPAKKASSCRL